MTHHYSVLMMSRALNTLFLKCEDTVITMLTWAMPVTVMLTPWEVYTAELVTVSVIVFRDILQPPTRFTLYFIVFYRYL